MLRLLEEPLAFHLMRTANLHKAISPSWHYAYGITTSSTSCQDTLLLCLSETISTVHRRIFPKLETLLANLNKHGRENTALDNEAQSRLRTNIKMTELNLELKIERNRLHLKINFPFYQSFPAKHNPVEVSYFLSEKMGSKNRNSWKRAKTNAKSLKRFFSRHQRLFFFCRNSRSVKLGTTV